MSQWEDKINSHTVNATLSNLKDRLTTPDIASEDANVIDLLDKLAQLVSYAEVCLKNAIHPLVNIGHLNNANSHLQNVLNELNAYISNKNIAHLNNASNHVDAVMVQLNALPMPPMSIANDSYSQSLVNFKNLVEGAFREIKRSKDELEESISEISKDSQAQEQNIESLTTQIAEHQERIKAAYSDFETRLDTFERDYSAKLDDALKDAKGDLAGIISDHKSEHAEQLTNHSGNAAKIIKTLEDKKKDASDLVQVIGNIGITGNYQKIANQEKEAADKWRLIALGLMVGMVVAIGATILISATNGFDWKVALFRIAAALVLAIPATYAAKESARHRALENHNRRAELELASLDPFLEKLPDETRHKVKEELTSRFFGLNTPDQKTEEPVSSTAILDLLKTVIEKK